MTELLGRKGEKLIVGDIRRAHIYAPFIRPVYMGIVYDDWLGGGEGLRGRLDAPMYGTRGAALNGTSIAGSISAV